MGPANTAASVPEGTLIMDQGLAPSAGMQQLCGKQKAGSRLHQCAGGSRRSRQRSGLTGDDGRRVLLRRWPCKLNSSAQWTSGAF